MTEIDRDEEEASALLDYLKSSHGFDFTGYKRSSVMRRVRRRMEHAAITTIADYLDYLQVHPEEFAFLFNTILINVTAFFRDAPAWDHVRDVVVPRILEWKTSSDPVRVWSAGCASGEEAYSLAIIMAEHMGIDEVKRRVKVYATDVDEEALTKARQAFYTEDEVSGVDPDHIAKYFEVSSGRLLIRSDLRRVVVFGRHDLVQDAPISHVDLLVCRNTLMYFNSDVQERVLSRMHFALNDGAFLFLGKAEMLLTHANLFAPVDMRSRIFAKVSKMLLRERLMVLAQARDAEAGDHLAREVLLRDLAAESVPAATLVVDLEGTVVTISALARTTFGLHQRDIGRQLHELEISHRPLDLRSRIDEAVRSGHPVLTSEVTRHVADGRDQVFNVIINPLVVNDGVIAGTSITFNDITYPHGLQLELTRSKQELETAFEELQSTNEELETTNEELQSSNEELETTNEELQSANEELETTNEELQSTNGELQAINNELRERSYELDNTNLFVGAVLSTLGHGIVVVDSDLRVDIWTEGAVDLWGLRAEETVGRPLQSLDFGLPVAAILSALRACLDGTADRKEVEVDALTRKGRSIRCQVVCAALQHQDGKRRGAIISVERISERVGRV